MASVRQMTGGISGALLPLYRPHSFLPNAKELGCTAASCHMPIALQVFMEDSKYVMTDLEISFQALHCMAKHSIRSKPVLPWGFEDQTCGQ